MTASVQIDVIIKVPYEHKPGDPWPFPNAGTLLLGEAAAQFGEILSQIVANASPEQAAPMRDYSVGQVGIIVRPYVVGDGL